MAVSDSLQFLLDHECLLFCVTDLVLIYKLVTSSASLAQLDLYDNHAFLQYYAL
jgi:hypothetical protein